MSLDCVGSGKEAEGTKSLGAELPGDPHYNKTNYASVSQGLSFTMPLQHASPIQSANGNN